MSIFLLTIVFVQRCAFPFTNLQYDKGTYTTEHQGLLGSVLVVNFTSASLTRERQFYSNCFRLLTCCFNLGPRGVSSDQVTLHGNRKTVSGGRKPNHYGQWPKADSATNSSSFISNNMRHLIIDDSYRV